MPEPSQSLDPRAVLLWRVQRLLRLAGVGLPVAAGLGVLLGSATRPLAGVVVAAALLAWQLGVALVWPRLAWEAYRYEVREHDLLVRSGVLFRRWSAIPLSRIQHVDTRQGPVERLFGLSRLLVFTASGMHADGSIPGLAAERAEALRDELSRRGGDDGV